MFRKFSMLLLLRFCGVLLHCAWSKYSSKYSFAGGKFKQLPSRSAWTRVHPPLAVPIYAVCRERGLLPKDGCRVVFCLELSFSHIPHMCSTFDAGGRKDECSAYLTHLSKIVTKDVALYTLFLQATFLEFPSLRFNCKLEHNISKLVSSLPTLQADALNHVWPYYLHLVMRAMQAIRRLPHLRY